MRRWLPILGAALFFTSSVRADDDPFASDPAAAKVVAEMSRTGKHVITTGAPETMDGGYRGKIKLVPQLPTGTYRKHLVWTRDAMASIDSFFGALYGAQDTAPNYRWTELTFKFVRSPGKRTPSAYAMDWSITYNVNGSLLTSGGGVLETLFHELFHLNDFAHDEWSAKKLQADFDAIVKKCGTSSKCLAPYAPNTTKVKATGTYYAFQPGNGNGVHEYAAELAVRYFREQTQMLRDKKLSGPAFKCGPAENARAWVALITEFFAGKDLVPACSV